MIDHAVCLGIGEMSSAHIGLDRGHYQGWHKQCVVAGTAVNLKTAVAGKAKTKTKTKS